MKKPLKYALFVVGGIILLLAIAIAVFAATFDPNEYKPLIVKLVQEKKQRTLNIEGDIKLAFWPKLGANLGKISLSEHKSDKQFASVESLQVSLALLPLLQKQLVVDTIYVDGARANIVRYKDGSTNFDDLLSEEEEQSEQIKFDIDGVIVTDSAVTYTDEQAGKQYAVSQFNLETGHVALAEPFDLETDFVLTASEPSVNAAVALEGNFMLDPEAKHYVAEGLDATIKGKLAQVEDATITLTGDVDAQPETLEFVVNGLHLTAAGVQDGAELNAELDAPKLTILKDEVSGQTMRISLAQQKGSDSAQIELSMADLQGSPRAIESSNISVNLTAKQGEHHIAGKFSSPFHGNLEALVFDLPKLAGKLNVQDPSLPNGEMQGTFNMRLHADAKQERFNSNFNLDIGATKLKGDVAVAGFSQPDIKFNVNGDQLDLNKLLGTPKTSPDSAANKQSAAADKPADLSALKDLRLQGTLNIGSILYDRYRLSGLNLGVKADGATLSVAPFAVKLDDSQIKGKFGIARFSKPIYSFDVDIDKLDADRYITNDNPPGKRETQAQSDPNTPIDLSALKNLNANGELRIGWLKLANVTSTNVRIKLKADDGVAELAPFSANLYEGSMNGSLRVDARNTPAIAFKQDMKGIAIGPLLVDAINNDMLTGKGSLNVDVTTQGGTVLALKKALAGTAAMQLADGAVRGIDIAGTLRGVKDKVNTLKSQTRVEGDKTQQTDFSEMTASFNIKNGVAHNEDLSMKSPLLRVTGSGDIDIAEQTINYLAKPTVVATLKGQGGADLAALNGLTVPVKVSGTFAKPAYAIDFAGLATALAKKQLLDKVGGEKGEAVQNLLEGNKEGALRSLIEGRKKSEAAPPASGETPPATATEPKAEPEPAKPEDKAKQKLQDLLGF